MKLNANQIRDIHSKTMELEHARIRLAELRIQAKNFTAGKVIFSPISNRSFVEEARFNTDLGTRLLGTMDVFFEGVIERLTKELASLGVEIEVIE